ncbi:hypothetical protein [Natrononativus amylolyticus]|uniref:hypothetical protein n=1 Tax=Natrononativus amylolyticus TaxID=2963434 RepID=UPI0020CCB981|nr:hypothetical protein [Natrononativus amylolyticus]
MRRIYDSSALHRDNDEPFSPNERGGSDRPQAMRSINSTAWSRRLVPNRLRHRAISVSVSTPRSAYPVGTPVPFEVTMYNSMPFPIVIGTRSPVVWTWHVDGVEEASHVPLRDPPDEPQGFRFDRGERKRFRRRWSQSFRVSDSEWEPATPGEHVIGVGLNVEDAAEKGLYAETTIEVVPE